MFTVLEVWIGCSLTMKFKETTSNRMVKVECGRYTAIFRFQGAPSLKWHEIELRSRYWLMASHIWTFDWYNTSTTSSDLDRSKVFRQGSNGRLMSLWLTYTYLFLYIVVLSMHKMNGRMYPGSRFCTECWRHHSDVIELPPSIIGH